MKHINITYKTESFGLQLFDKWYAYRQSLDTDNYKSDILITHQPNAILGATNIWFEYMPTSVDKKMFDYDLIFLCNGSESLKVSTSAMIALLKKDNVYIVADGYVTKDHPMHSKIIWHPIDPMLCNDYWSRPFYPQLYNNHANVNKTKIGSIYAINGANRPHRDYFFNLLKTQVPTVKLKNTFDAINKLQPSLIESKEDTVFRLTMNTIYKDTLETFRKTPSSSITVGTDNKFGSVLPGYFILDEYFEYHCIVYPETTWQNDELTLTEKGMKCFYSECLPMPVGGSNINQLYNSLGYYTAWNLLPAKLQSYDSNKNHQDRYQQQITAIKWLSDNTDVLISSNAVDMIAANKQRLLSNAMDYIAVKIFDQQFFGQLDAPRQ